MRRIERVDAHADRRCGNGGHGALATGGRAGEMGDERLLPGFGEESGELLRLRAIAGGQHLRRSDRLDERQQAFVQRRSAHEEVQHRFREGELRGEERFAGANFDQVPAAQRTQREGGAPVCFGQHAQR
jgi:hypothetical protein